MNRLPRFYHHGATEDLSSVVDHAIAKGFDSIVLMGLSMGGSMSLKYLGESTRPIEVKGAVYEKRFLSKHKNKIELKAEIHEMIDSALLIGMTDFEVFHEHFTVPLHCFSSLDEFYQSATCDQFLDHIIVPVFIGNALNDPLLEAGCYPVEKAYDLKNIYLKIPQFGGHVGFSLKGDFYTWIEYESDKFIINQLGLI